VRARRTHDEQRHQGAPAPGARGIRTLEVRSLREPLLTGQTLIGQGWSLSARRRL
jgi:hypothetical protein